MPLRCLDSSGGSIHSFDLPDEQWRALEVENRRARHLRMPCCSAQVTLKRSRLGTPFFAHKAVGACATIAETEAHLQLKKMAVEVARANGWTADTEVIGTSPSGEMWKADVLACKSKHNVAIEVQWSNQKEEEILKRQFRYRESDIRCLWLIRQSHFPNSRDLPAVRIGGSLDQGFLALTKSRAMPIGEFLHAVFSRRFWFGVKLGTNGAVSVRAGCLWCWCCGARTRIITGIDLNFDANELSFQIAELGEYAQPLSDVLTRLPVSLEIGSIKRRFSKTRGLSYVSNGCLHCGVLIGDFYEHEAWYEQEIVSAFSIRISPQWQAAIENHCGYEPAWSVHEFPGVS